MISPIDHELDVEIWCFQHLPFPPDTPFLRLEIELNTVTNSKVAVTPRLPVPIS